MLSDFTEGLIGKVQIRKSGKVQLVIGDITLDVLEGAAFSFLQVRLHTAAQVKHGRSHPFVFTFIHSRSALIMTDEVV